MVSVQSDAAQGTGSATDDTIIVLATVAAALASGHALDAAIAIGTFTNAAAEIALGIGVAIDAAVDVEEPFVAPSGGYGDASYRRPRPMVEPPKFEPIVVSKLEATHRIAVAETAYGAGSAYSAVFDWNDDEEAAIILLLATA